ncbi:hypothetical protein [Polyangium aurulentum]|uniref:hypothetical protein n=1 Tax=Polyangium aurulentum TaxID=2567896 RepID=UPI0010AE62DA|nr:hypothetical protein [Polyangium aurulentum]UQA61562.1 hypothetical protein E8A73_014260 [Polyangium aurulentum]
MARHRPALLVATLAAATIATLGSATRARAEDKPAPAAEAPLSDTYKRHMSNGVKLFNDHNYAAAVVEFEAAYAERPRASPLLNIALCYKSLFNYPKAIAALELALSKHGDTLDAPDRQAAEQAVAEMKTLIGYVVVSLDPPGATLLVDGEPQPPEALDKPLPLGPGRHRIGARAEGYASAEQIVTVTSADKSKPVRIALVAEKGWVVVKTDDPEMIIAIDKQPMGQGEWTGLLAPGTHIVQMYRPDGPEHTEQVLVVAGKAIEVRPNKGGVPIELPRTGLPPPPPPPPSAKPLPEPPTRGAYAQATGGFFWMLNEENAGGTAGARIGYRLSTRVGLELMFDYANIKVESAVPTVKVPLSSARFGGGFRLMSAGRRVRFVATIGGGFAYNWLAGGKSPGGTAFANLDTGLELDFGGVLLGLAAQQTLLLGGADTVDIELKDPRVLFGGGARIGFGTW